MSFRRLIILCLKVIITVSGKPSTGADMQLGFNISSDLLSNVSIILIFHLSFADYITFALSYI
jgi:hypothetical protein